MTARTSKYALLFAIFVIASCTESRVKRYNDLLEPELGKGKKAEVSKLLGAPTYCKEKGKYEVCEYRTARGRNEQTPFVHRKEPAMAPDLTPYEHFDVIQVSYDGFGVVQAWEPIVLPTE